MRAATNPPQRGAIRRQCISPAPSSRSDSRLSAATSTGDLCPGRGRRTGGMAAGADATNRGPDRVHGFLLPQWAEGSRGTDEDDGPRLSHVRSMNGDPNSGNEAMTEVMTTEPK